MRSNSDFVTFHQESRAVMIGYRFVFILLVCFYAGSSWANSHHPQEFLKHIAGTKDEGAQIVTHYCANCHAVKPMIPLGAPRQGEKKDWAPRIRQGLSVLFKHTDEGMNAMPSRGGCFECTDEQLWMAIIELLPKSAVKKSLSKP